MDFGDRIGRRILATGVALSTTVSAGACGMPAFEVPAEPAHVVAFIGDSYTQPSEPGPAYWQTTAFRMCWQARQFGGFGTGYTMQGPAGEGAFWTRLDEVQAAKPDIVIVQGSFNDLDPVTAGIAASALFQALHDRLPGVQVFAMGPVSPPLTSIDRKVGPLNDAIKAAAESNWTVFIDARQALTDPAFFADDEIHLTDLGHKVLGAKLAEAIPTDLSSCE